MKHLYLIFIATFVIGFLSGVLVYLQSHTGKEGDGAIEDTPNGFVVTASRFGGESDFVSTSYRLTENGSYTYIERSEGSAEVKNTGTLPKQELSLLRTKITEVNYDEINGSTFVGVCPITTGGYAYRYTILYDGAEYAFDSCKQVTAGNSFFEVLNTYFKLLEESHSNT
jgi:hypothetical protein